MPNDQIDTEIPEPIIEEFGKCSFCGEDGLGLMRGPEIAANFEGEAQQYLLDAFALVGLYDAKERKTASRGHVLICESCAFWTADWFEHMAADAKESKKRSRPVQVTPSRIHSTLNKHVIGQDRAKKELSIALWQHYMRMRAGALAEESRRSVDRDVEIDKSNVMLIGPTGVGKTLLVKVLAKFLDVPMVTVDVTSISSAGYKGADASDCLRRLFIESGYNMYLAQYGVICLDEVDKIVAKVGDDTPDVGGSGVQQAFLKLIEGADISFEAILPSGQKTELTMDTRNILFVASGAFPDLPRVIKDRMGQKHLGFAGGEQKKSEDAEVLRKVIHDDLVKYGFLAEFCGRFPIIETLDALSRSDLERILVEPQSSLVKQFKKLFRIFGVELDIAEEVLSDVVDEAVTEKLGARALRGAFEKRLKHAEYVVPDLKLENKRLKKVIVDKTCASGGPPLCEYRPQKTKVVAEKQ